MYLCSLLFQLSFRECSTSQGHSLVTYTVNVVISRKRCQIASFLLKNVKGKGFPCSLPSVGPGADPGVQAVNLQDAGDYKLSTRQ